MCIKKRRQLSLIGRYMLTVTVRSNVDVKTYCNYTYMDCIFKTLSCFSVFSHSQLQQYVCSNIRMERNRKEGRSHKKIDEEETNEANQFPIPFLDPQCIVIY